MKIICMLMAIGLLLGFADAWASEDTFKSALDHRLTVIGGI
jgi:hypothetical protein